MEKNEKKQSRYPWHKAPKWAKFAATDRDGKMWWFEKRPELYNAEWLHCNVEQIYLECPDFAESLESRPDNI
jgi:hypothetical protein